MPGLGAHDDHAIDERALGDEHHDDDERADDDDDEQVKELVVVGSRSGLYLTSG